MSDIETTNLEKDSVERTQLEYPINLTKAIHKKAKLHRVNKVKL